MPAAKPKIKVQCHWCNKILERPLWHAKRQQQHFCDRKCKGAWLKTQTGQNAYAYKGTQVQVKCSECGKEVLRDPTKVERNEHFFCGRVCFDAWRRVHMQGENNPNWTPPIKTQCATCGEPIERNPARVGTTERKVHFCSKACKHKWMSEYLSGEGCHFWKGGSGQRYYGQNWFRQARFARKRDGYRCQNCGVSQKEIGKSLDVHHIIPFRSFDYIPGENENYLQANELSNLISLCRNCHMRVEAHSIPLQPKLL